MNIRPVESLLRTKLLEVLAPTHLSLDNESPMHGLSLDAEKHFRLVVVSARFEGLARVARHRLVHDILAEELRERVHALSVQAFTPDEWAARLAGGATEGGTHSSPECLGGGKKERKF